MEINTENIIGGLITAAPIILLIIKLFATEYVTKFTQELFNSKTKKKANLIFNLIVVFLLIIGLLIILSPYIVKEKINIPAEEQEQQEVITQKSDAEIALEAGQIIYDEVKTEINNYKERNKEIIANREKRWVYQIGDIFDNEESVLSLYKNLKTISSVDISRIFVFKIKRNKFFLYKDDGYDIYQINDSLATFKMGIANIERKVEIIDLLQYCLAKESVIGTKALKFRKEKIEIPCCNCDK